MGCSSEHMNRTTAEAESVKVMGFLKEIGFLDTRIPYYGLPNTLNEHTEMLCYYCQHHDVKGCSLELQIWWRNHQEADKRRIKEELESEQTIKDREIALAKLTPYERKLLGVEE